jgi:hypothetical protein
MRYVPGSCRRCANNSTKNAIWRNCAPFGLKNKIIMNVVWGLKTFNFGIHLWTKVSLVTLLKFVNRGYLHGYFNSWIEKIPFTNC